MSEENTLDPVPSTDAEYWFNLSTGEVEQGRQSSWTHRMGPFKTREDAQRALEKAKERSEAWDEDDERWNGS
ncbi:hypothetical protein DNL40_06280 [Xylanimonas oleitrophica]|uniref:SPOR domain-containing protein n=1 Tax=Xylanimonas oleitrophica TaxID=2607479 RepID=A0A2W5XU55_9MICO|nr:SPOR domain-containing protein [Xylanimonas oleitrophica]PZR53728.1 hypothetical protein DNL40_06280 [Xylanimonas oleitrophica]